MNRKQFNSRRQALLAKMAPASAAIIFSAPEVIRSSDSAYPYRQSSNFWYLTGFNEPEAVLVLIKNTTTDNYTVLFNRERDLKSEIWFSPYMGQNDALAVLSVDRALPFNNINQELHLLLNGLHVVYHAPGEYDYADQIFDKSLKILRNKKNRAFQAPLTQTDWRPWVHEIRLFKSSEELVIIKRASEISASAHTNAIKKCHPNMFEYQLEAEIHYEFMRLGARYPAYATIVGSGANACILHYTENECIMRDGDLVLIDAGCEYQGYASDITRTIPVNGKFSHTQRAVYDIVLDAQLYALKALKPGISIREVNDQVVRIMIAKLINIGVMKGEVEQLFADQVYKKFYMHGLSHWIGLDVHDGVYCEKSICERVLEPGMILSVEPGLYIATDADVLKEYRGIGIRIEDEIAITANGNENLTASVVKDADAIEALMASVGQNK